MKLRIQTCKGTELTLAGISTPVLLRAVKRGERERQQREALPPPASIQSRERCFLTFK